MGTTEPPTDPDQPEGPDQPGEPQRRGDPHQPVADPGDDTDLRGTPGGPAGADQANRPGVPDGRERPDMADWPQFPHSSATPSAPDGPRDPPASAGPRAGDGWGAYGWLTPQQVSRTLGVSVRQVYRLVDRGEIPAYRIGGAIRLRADDVDSYRRKQSQEGDG